MLLAIVGVIAAAGFVLSSTGTVSRHATEHVARKAVPPESRRGGELAAKRILSTDPAMKPLFGSRRVTVVESGPWNAQSSRKVIGFALVVTVEHPVHGTYSLPHITSYRTGSFRRLKTDAAGARKFEVVVSFQAKRVADVSPVELPAVRRKVIG
jgi:hypothetical protein